MYPGFSESRKNQTRSESLISPFVFASLDPESSSAWVHSLNCTKANETIPGKHLPRHHAYCVPVEFNYRYLSRCPGELENKTGETGQWK